MSVLSIGLLIFIGIILFLVEFFILPGITLAGIGGFLLIGGGVFCGYYFHGVAVGNIILLSSSALMVLVFVFVLKSKTWQRYGLKETVEGKVGKLQESAVSQGDVGETVSKLAPMGKALINETLFEVRSEGSYIDAHKKITVSRIDGNKIFVEVIN